MYITGGIGSSRGNEGFTFDYDLPPETAYAETCAAVALVFWNHRLLQLTCDSRYADVMERALYNGVISGISLDGKSFFYVNPLASLGNHHREAWFNCACCPPNIARLLASLGEYIYSTSETDLAVHLYIGGESRLNWRGQRLSIRQETRYPWEGNIKLSMELDHPDRFGIKLRLPGWCRKASLKINGQPVDIAGKLDQGYIHLEQEWQNGDQVELALEMQVERVHAHPNVRQAAGRVALQRGPVVYCVEQVDQTNPLDHLRLPRSERLVASLDPDLLGGVVTIHGEAAAVDQSVWGDALYQSAVPELQPVPFKAVPYYAWDNRQPGAMLVWIPEI
jgi:uncharacterized protein